MDQIFNICGWIGSLGLILGYLPQAIHTIRTRQTDGISLPGFIMMSVGSFCFMCQGIMLGREGIFMLITNAITCLCSVIIFFIKIKNDRAKR
jgi:MtN3 and saliva related transmembrane protein